MGISDHIAEDEPRGSQGLLDSERSRQGIALVVSTMPVEHV